MLEPPYDGGCLCGGLRYRCAAAAFVGYTCHCRACQRLTSSAFATCMHVPTEAVELLSGEVAVTHRTSDSGNILASTLCPDCGSAVFAKNSARPRATTVYVGTLDQPELVPVTEHIWTKRKLPWVVIPPGHSSYVEAGDFRKYYVDDPSRLEP